MEYISGVAIWNVETGKLVDCIVKPCDNNNQDTKGNYWIGSNLSPNGKWATRFNPTEITVTNFIDHGINISTTHGSENHTLELGLVDFNPLKDYYAAAFREGEIIISKIGYLGVLFPRNRLGVYSSQTSHDVEALQYSSDGRLLARIQDDVLTVWEIGFLNSEIVLTADVPAGQLITFDQTSKFVFIGTNEKIIVLDINEKTEVAEFPASDISSLSISEDNKLLVWGDEQGKVHVWGIRR